MFPLVSELHRCIIWHQSTATKILKPEKSITYEAGLQFNNAANTINLRGSYFNRKIKDVIIFKSLFTPPYGQYANADEQNDHGFELEATYKPTEKLNLSANYAFVDGEINTTSSGSAKDTSFFNLYRRPQNTFNLHAGYEFTPKLYTGLGLRTVGKRTDVYSDPFTFESSKIELDGYYNLDLYVSYQIKPALKLFADLRNITNQEYFDLYGYNSRKFNFMAGISFSTLTKHI
jgi:vitamin B12 transporter